MILQTKYFDLETNMFSFKNPEAIRQWLEENYCNYFTEKPSNETVIYNDSFKLHLKYKLIDDSVKPYFEFSVEELLFPEVGCIEGYKITDSDYSCRGYQYYELNHTYSIEEDPIPCKSGFHFCKKLIDCFKYYPPKRISYDIYDLDTHKYLKVKSNGTTYQHIDKYCTNNITILEECTTEEILEAFHKWISYLDCFNIKLRDEYYECHNGIFHKVIPGEKLNNQPTWYIYYEED